MSDSATNRSPFRRLDLEMPLKALEDDISAMRDRIFAALTVERRRRVWIEAVRGLPRKATRKVGACMLHACGPAVRLGIPLPRPLRVCLIQEARLHCGNVVIRGVARPLCQGSFGVIERLERAGNQIMVSGWAADRGAAVAAVAVHIFNGERFVASVEPTIIRPEFELSAPIGFEVIVLADDPKSVVAVAEFSPGRMAQVFQPA